MVSLEAVRTMTGDLDPSLETVLKYLEEHAKPIATEKRPLQVVAPAVYVLHTSISSLLVGLSAKKLTPIGLRSLALRMFSKASDCYVVLKGISPPTDPVERVVFDSEVDFSRKFVELSLRLCRETAGSGDAGRGSIMLAPERLESYKEELSLRSQHLLPEFASMHCMQRRSNYGAIAGWIFMVLFILWQMGFLAVFLENISRSFRGE